MFGDEFLSVYLVEQLSQLVRADADTSVKANYYQMFNVTVSYFDVLRISDREGRPIRPIVEESTGRYCHIGGYGDCFFQGGPAKVSR